MSEEQFKYKEIGPLLIDYELLNEFSNIYPCYENLFKEIMSNICYTLNNIVEETLNNHHIISKNILRNIINDRICDISDKIFNREFFNKEIPFEFKEVSITFIIKYLIKFNINEYINLIVCNFNYGVKHYKRKIDNEVIGAIIYREDILIESIIITNERKSNG